MSKVKTIQYNYWCYNYGNLHLRILTKYARDLQFFTEIPISEVSVNIIMKFQICVMTVSPSK